VKLIVGLGNPGREYEQTRHNVGWMVLDRIADRAGWSGRGKERDAAVVVRGRYRDQELVLAKPMTYMNESGIAVRKLLARERVPLSDLLIVYDDFDLPLGKLRMRESGSAGTHNGLRSVVAEMETQKIPRLRVGIGEPGLDRARSHVLSRFTQTEREQLESILNAAADAVEEWAAQGAARAANRWNAWSLPSDHVAATNDGEPDMRASTPEQRADAAAGITRTKTGWRKLLPRGDQERER
jgi:peptidyl-tRNA hydrolase, PTH1 family